LPAKRIAILGSTGSIGCSALDVIENLGADYRVAALSAHRQMDKLLEQVRKFKPKAVTITDEKAAREVGAKIEHAGAKLYIGEDGLVEMVQRDDVDTVLAAIVGAAGLPAVLASVKSGKALALANKESLVVAGSLLIPEARKRNVPILPVDSEHSAVFQAMASGRHDEVKRVILTASGGPFRKSTLDEIQNATPKDAMNHPTWRMGNKITIDSATMFNKALELIEACWLFDLPPEKVEIVIHPESVIHSMVEFVDNSVIAQLSPPDMRTPIQYALTYPERKPGISRRLDLTKAQTLHFEPPDFARFPALQVAYDVAKAGGTAGAVMNAANEVAVESFVAGNIAFPAIAETVAATIQRHKLEQKPDLSDLLDADRWARATARELIQADKRISHENRRDDKLRPPVEKTLTRK